MTKDGESPKEVCLKSGHHCAGETDQMAGCTTEKWMWSSSKADTTSFPTTLYYLCSIRSTTGLFPVASLMGGGR